MQSEIGVVCDLWHLGEGGENVLGRKYRTSLCRWYCYRERTEILCSLLKDIAKAAVLLIKDHVAFGLYLCYRTVWFVKFIYQVGQ